jgi:sterol desaturase/sphingolipid hydroxylase (fatty acid hydroxylase superfamily)
MVHHRVFRADHTYHVQNKTAEAKIPMTWWNGPVMILAACLPFTAMAALTCWWLLLGAFVAACTYYATYEYLHWCMHKPKRRVVERSGIFFLLNGHHLLHHRYMQKNFNVVLPLADLCLNTLIVRSKVCFAQARGESVPDVQPKAAARKNAQPEPTLSYCAAHAGTRLLELENR